MVVGQGLTGGRWCGRGLAGCGQIGELILGLGGLILDIRGNGAYTWTRKKKVSEAGPERGGLGDGVESGVSTVGNCVQGCLGIW